MRPAVVLVSFLMFASSVGLSGPEGRPVRQAYSENKEYRLRITPGRTGEVSGRPCLAELQHRPRGGRPERKWETELVNEVAPLQAFVHDSGKWVVTLDEYQKGGAAHALVVYDEKGEPAREWTLDEMLPPEELTAVERRGQLIDWLKDAEQIGFDRVRPHFVVQLATRRTIRVDLERMELIESSAPVNVIDAEGEKEATATPMNALMELLSAGEGMAEQLLSAMDPNQPIEGVVMFPGGIAGNGKVFITDPNTLSDVIRENIERYMRRAGEADGLLADELPVDIAARMEPPGPRSRDDVPAPQPDEWVDYVAWTNTHTEAGEAAMLIEEASEITPEVGLDDELWDLAWEGDPDALASAELDDYLEAHEIALATLREAEALGSFNGYELSNAEGEDPRMIGVMLPTLGKVRTLNRVSVFRGKQLAASGDFAGAADEYFDVLRSGGTAGRGTTMIEGLVGVAVERLATESLLDLYADDVDGSLDYTEMVSKFEQSQTPMRPFQQTLQFERAMMLDEIQRLYEFDEYSGYQLAPNALRDFSSVISMSEGGADGAVLAYGMALSAQGFEKIRDGANDHYDEIANASSLPYPDAVAAFDSIEQNLDALRLQNPIVSVLAPAMGRANAMFTQGEANRRAAQTVARIRAYQQEFGTLPETLDEIGAHSDFIDPFTNGTLRYQRDGDGFRLYSPGADLVDDGGVVGARWTEGDVQYWPRPNRE